MLLNYFPGFCTQVETTYLALNLKDTYTYMMIMQVLTCYPLSRFWIHKTVDLQNSLANLIFLCLATWFSREIALPASSTWINYTTYELCHETDSVTPQTNYQDIMLLARRDRSDSQPFCYAHVLAIYHANIIYVGPESKNYQAQRLDFFWACWFELLDQPSGWKHCALDKARFVPMAQADLYSFVDPADILRCCHFIPSFADGKLHPDGVTLSHNVCDSDDWKFYYINQLVSFTTGI